ncbi:MAG: hypothetical protein ACFFD4_35705 [Candidatus Odinarchaeota archaeon]
MIVSLGKNNWAEDYHFYINLTSKPGIWTKGNLLNNYKSKNGFLGGSIEIVIEFTVDEEIQVILGYLSGYYFYELKSSSKKPTWIDTDHIFETDRYTSINFDLQGTNGEIIYAEIVRSLYSDMKELQEYINSSENTAMYNNNLDDISLTKSKIYSREQILSLPLYKEFIEINTINDNYFLVSFNKITKELRMIPFNSDSAIKITVELILLDDDFLDGLDGFMDLYHIKSVLSTTISYDGHFIYEFYILKSISNELEEIKLDLLDILGVTEAKVERITGCFSQQIESER